MENILTYRNRVVTNEDVETVRKIIAINPTGSRRFISQEVCRSWDWKQSNGMLKDMVCRSLLILLEKKGLIKQPPPKCIMQNPLANRMKPKKVEVDQSPIKCSIKELMPIRLEMVRRTEYEKLFNSLISEYHYLGYTQTIGEHLKYIAFKGDLPISCIIWGSAPWYIGARDKYIGWSKEIRKKNLFLIANNTRFLILPWVEVPCLATYLLALNRKQLSRDWEELYNHPIHLVETFVDKELYYGTCYKADNWVNVGETTGLGKLSKTKIINRSKKDVYVYPLTRNYRKELCNDKG